MAAAVAAMFGLMVWVIKAFMAKRGKNGTKSDIGHLKSLLEDTADENKVEFRLARERDAKLFDKVDDIGQRTSFIEGRLDKD